MRTKYLVLGCAIASLSAGTAAMAAEHGVYAGFGFGQTDTDIEGGIGALLDGEDNDAKLVVGWRPLDWLAVEGGYVGLGEVKQTRNIPDFSDFKVEQNGYDVFGVFLWDIAFVDLFAKVGVVSWSADLSASTLAGHVEASDDATERAWGLGAQARFGRLALRLEYERFDVSALTGLEPPELTSLGLTWTF